MPVIRVIAKKAESTKQALLAQKILDHRFMPVSERGFVYFPVTNIPAGMKASRKKLPETLRQTSFHELLRKKLTDNQMLLVPRAFDTVGSIAILDLPDELLTHETLIGKALLKAQPRIKTVLRRGVHEGTFRTQALRFIVGIDTREATLSENNVRLKVNLETVYFSVRLSNERKRIASLVKPGERVLVMFSGAGPYVCVLGKNTEAREIIGVEINPAGHRYAEENIRMNKLTNCQVHCGDVRNLVPKLGVFDRILMPLPHSSEDFLDTAINAAKETATIHFYRFLHDDEFSKAEQWCRKACARNKRSFRKLGFTLCGQSAPGTFRTCLDFSVRK